MSIGMGMPGRKYSIANTNYRYGFNGKELDKEASSTTSYDYGFRIYSPALGRFLSVDPLASKFAMLTPYQFAGNRPIDGIDLDGLEIFKKDNTSYRIDYKPVVDASGIGAGIGNAVHNAIGFVWNGTFGAILEGKKILIIILLVDTKIQFRIFYQLFIIGKITFTDTIHKHQLSSS